MTILPYFDVLFIAEAYPARSRRESILGRHHPRKRMIQ